MKTKLNLFCMLVILFSILISGCTGDTSSHKVDITVDEEFSTKSSDTTVIKNEDNIIEKEKPSITNYDGIQELLDLSTLSNPVDTNNMAIDLFYEFLLGYLLHMKA